MEHSKTFGISGAGRWVECNGSIKLISEQDPKEPTQDTMEGDATHSVGEGMLKAFKLDGDYLALGQSMIGVTHINGVIITEDMFDVALAYVLQIVKVVGDDPKRKAMLIVEQVVKANSIDPECWGTPDAFFYDIQTNTLHVWDLKNGHGRVGVFENYQLLGYSQAICETFNYTRINPRLSLNIVQPRCYDGKGAVQNWTIAFDMIRAYVNRMKSAVGEYRMVQSKLRTGAWCKNCDAEDCPALQNAAANAIDVSMETMRLNLGATALAYEKTMVDAALERLTNRKSAIDAQVETRIRNGDLIPGFSMQDTISSKKWKNKDAKTIGLMGEMLGVKTLKDPEPLTPTQVLAELKKNKIDESVIMPYYHTTKTGVKVVPDDGTKAKRIFSQEKI